MSSPEPVPRKTLAATAVAIALFYVLLWSPHWYPLSDSALYLNMARALARGQGLESIRQLHRDVRPFTPLLLAAIMKLGGGIGTMHAVMIGLMLASHALMFLTLRRWFTERTALLATIATATSWWVYANAFTIMTEPLFLVMFWAAMLALNFVPGTSQPKQWSLVIIAALCMAGAWENRVAAALLLPGTLFGLWMSNPGTPRPQRLAWIGLFTLVFAFLLWDYRRPTPGAAQAAAKEETYHLNVLVGIKHPLVELPVSAGRWIIEGLAAAGAMPFDLARPVRIIASFVSVAILLLACIGWLKLWRSRHWYAVGMALYFLPCVALWGARIKPRYMAPIAPILFIQLCAGMNSARRTSLLEHGSSDCHPERSEGRAQGVEQRRSFGVRQDDIACGSVLPFVNSNFVIRHAPALLLVAVLALNLIPYAIEVYLRHGSSRDFYDTARRGAFAELIDIGAYVEKHAEPTDVIAVNWPPPSSRPPDANFAPDRRIVQFLTDRDVQFMKPVDPKQSDRTRIDGPADRARLDEFFHQVPDDWAVVYYSGHPWPSYHLPLAASSDPGPRWWQLFHRDPASGAFEPVTVPKQRDDVRNIPGLKR